MKLKYKKIIITATMATMVVGLATLSFGGKKDKDSTRVEDITTMKSVNQDAQVNNENDNTADTSSTNQEIATAAATNVSATDSELELNAYEPVNKLVEQYLDATLKCDIDTLQTIMSDTSSLSVDELQKKSEYLDEYQNIDCYTKIGPVEGSYVVYVYSELKIADVSTLAPGLTRFYVTTGEDGQLKIFTGELDDTTQQFIQETGTDEKVVDLIDSVNQKLAVAVSSDADLKAFVNKLDEGTKEAKKVINEANAASDTKAQTEANTSDGNDN